MPCWSFIVVAIVVAVILLVQWVREEPPGMKRAPDDLELVEEAEAILRRRGMTWDQAMETTARLSDRGMTAREIDEAIRLGRYE